KVEIRRAGASLQYLRGELGSISGRNHRDSKAIREELAFLRGPNVDVDVKDVLGIVFGLELPEAAVVGPIRSGYRVPRFVVIEIVYIAHRGEERFQATECPAAPGDAWVVLAGIHPLRDDGDVEAGHAHG